MVEGAYLTYVAATLRKFFIFYFGYVQDNLRQKYIFMA
jgi:hypothetical protein